MFEPSIEEKMAQFEQRHDKVILQMTMLVNTWQSLATLKWEVLPHPLDSPGIVPSDYYHFRSKAHALADPYFASYDDVKKWVDSWLHPMMTSSDELPER